MITVVIAAILVGALLSLRYRVFVLIPSIMLTCVYSKRHWYPVGY